MKNPFAADVTRMNRASGLSKAGWIVAGILAVALIAVALLWESAISKVRELEALRSALDDANANITNALAQVQRDQDQMASLQSELAHLEQEKNAVRQAAKRLEDEMRADLESKDVTISKLQGKLTVNILDRVMFDSGEAVLKPDGESVLRKIAALLAEHSDLKIHVIGHTDNLPIRNRFTSNWELSTARALAAVHFLTEKAGVAPGRVGAVGYGEFRPIVDNTTPENRAKNRRIAITILPNELAGADVAPSGQTNPPSDTPPEPALPGRTEPSAE